MSASPSRKRRKVAAGVSVPAELAASDGSGRPADEQVKEPPPPASVSAAPTLPAAVWGRVLDYLLYDEVRQAILANKFMANTVPSYVEAIWIRKPSNLDAVAARRFPNVKYVRIECLTRWDDKETCILSATTARRAVPFLIGFSKLKGFFIGGNNPDPEVSGFGYSPKHCVFPDDHEDLMRGMTRSLCNAFESRALSQQIRVLGFLGDYTRTHVCRPARAIEGRPCKLCKEICVTFPRSFVKRVYRKEDSRSDILRDMSDICMTSRDFVTALKARLDGEAFLRDEGKGMVRSIITDQLCFFDLDRENANDARIIHRLEEEGINEPTAIIWYDDDSFISLKCIFENGFDPKTLTKEEVMESIDIEGPRAIFDTTLDRLCNLGIPLDKSVFFIVDEEDVRRTRRVR